MVYKSVSLRSQSAPSPAALAAIAEELKTMEDLLFGMHTILVIELWELRVRAPYHDALVVYAHLALGCKELNAVI